MSRVELDSGVNLFAFIILLQLTAAQKLPHRFDSSVAYSQHSVVEHESKIAITGYGVHFFSDWQVDL